MRIFNFLALAFLFLAPAQAFSQQGPVPVFTSLVEKQSFFDETEALGTLQANENVALNSTVTELVTEINFDDGQRVKKGDVLVKMDASQEIALKAEEQSRLNEAQRQVNRIKPLISRGAASKSLLDEANLELQTAKARINALEAQIAERKILAPFDGVVGLRNISVGALAQPGTMITTIDDDTVMKLDFSVPEVFLDTLKEGLELEAKTDAYPNEIFTAVVSSVSSRIDPVTRSIAARALLDNDNKKLKPGMLMRVRLKKNPRQTLLIPEEALVVQGTEKSVFVVQQQGEDQIAEKRVIETGTRRKGQIEVLSGLKSGEQLITHGTLRVRSGAQVKIEAVEKDDEPLTDLLKQKNDGE